ncbi:hypothetical protein ACE193_10165 [Bernardetia sp. OM2101]|uniref:hypothetical protein n=1 Tax=Bernardetia sp. OM2101 TaxID=3344876 RepID=UPI0035CFF1A3
MIDQKNIKEMVLNCTKGSDKNFILDSNEVIFLVQKINSAKPLSGKTLAHKFLTIYLKNNDTIKLYIRDNHFKYPKKGDQFYELDIDRNYFTTLCSRRINKNILEENKLEISEPIETISRIFNQYNEFQESTDSPHNLDSLKQSLYILEKKELSPSDLELIINVWMYYTVTDFSTQKYTQNTLLAHKEQSIEAVKKRMKNKMKWENNDTAPFSELKYLLQNLEMTND